MLAEGREQQLDLALLVACSRQAMGALATLKRACLETSTAVVNCLVKVVVYSAFEAATQPAFAGQTL